ncbi:MAG: 2-dehydro-3-deoxygalactonokinase [Planctomycetia bacterium]
MTAPGKPSVIMTLPPTPPDAVPPAPRLVGLDWGTSSLRAYLFAGDGTVAAHRAEPWGIQHLPAGGYAAAFRAIVGDWLARWPDLPVLAAGMVGSRTGWREVCYAACPADAAGIAAGIVPFASECGVVHLVPGLVQEGESADVMRGEETQIFGALAREPALAVDALFVLPGTHCKWARVETGRVTRFTTYITGELFALLRDHSLLGRPARDAAGGTAATAAAAFRRGLDAARASGAGGGAAKLFTARSLFLAGDLAAADVLDYLSGLLVGDEVRSALVSLGPERPPCVVIGAATLATRYQAALGAFGVGDARVIDDTAPAGLWAIARAAGLVAA